MFVSHASFSLAFCIAIYLRERLQTIQESGSKLKIQSVQFGKQLFIISSSSPVFSPLILKSLLTSILANLLWFQVLTIKKNREIKIPDRPPMSDSKSKSV